MISFVKGFVLLTACNFASALKLHTVEGADTRAADEAETNAELQNELHARTTQNSLTHATDDILTYQQQVFNEHDILNKHREIDFDDPVFASMATSAYHDAKQYQQVKTYPWSKGVLVLLSVDAVVRQYEHNGLWKFATQQLALQQAQSVLVEETRAERAAAAASNGTVL
jgi:hypothetical protein